MRIEDLPILQKEDISENTPVADIAEVMWDSFYGCYKGNEQFTSKKLFYVLGRSNVENIGEIIFVANSSGSHGLYEREINHLPIEHIKEYQSLSPSK